MEAVVTLAHLAAVTERVGLGFGVVVLPQRQPVPLAKQPASIGVLQRPRPVQRPHPPIVLGGHSG
ncbi:MAG TPA: LLM class flavin-dependent oxidoreductase [Actinophytocola sp.]|nr:LLM class flavin-dependent oxidoreductase [Actinophytocola sp.]